MASICPTVKRLKEMSPFLWRKCPALWLKPRKCLDIYNEIKLSNQHLPLNVSYLLSDTILKETVSPASSGNTIAGINASMLLNKRVTENTGHEQNRNNKI